MTSWLFFIIGFFVTINPTRLDANSLPSELSGENLLTQEKISHDWSKAKQATVLVFLSSTCPCSHSHLTPLKELVILFPGISFIGIHSNVNEERAQARDYFKEQQVNFPILSDPEAKIANLFKAVRTPHVFLVNREGDILYRGGVSSSADYSKATAHYLKITLEHYSKGVPLERTETRVLGCQIQRP